MQDEDAIQVNNGAYTNTVIKLLLGSWGPAAARLLNIPIPRAWKDIAEAIPIPLNTDGNLIEEYTGMPGDIKIKQADVVLINYPLDYQISTQIARNNLEYVSWSAERLKYYTNWFVKYALRNSPTGPQMTWSTHSISEAQLQIAGCAAYTYLLYSIVPYVRPPFFQFSELIEDDASKNGGTEPAFPFLTGHGGYLQIFTHGLTGMRPHVDALYLDPTLPPQLGDGGVQVKGVKWRGAVFDIDIQLDRTNIYRRENIETSNSVASGGSVRIQIGDNNPKGGNYSLGAGQSLIIPTRRPDLNMQGNHALCRPVSSDDEYMPGHFPLSVVDGSLSSVWQPTLSSKGASVTIDLGRHLEGLRRVDIGWGALPPEGFSISLRSSDAESWKEVLRVGNVNISAPFEPYRAKEVRIVDSNRTVGVFDQSHNGRYVKLLIWGTQDIDKAIGPTVGEFKIF